MLVRLPILCAIGLALAVDQMPSVTVLDPDQLVVGVPVRLQHLAVADAVDAQLDRLQSVRLGGQIVDRGLGHSPHSRESPT